MAMFTVPHDNLTDQREREREREEPLRWTRVLSMKSEEDKHV